MSFAPAGFEDSDDDDYDFGEGESFQFSSNSNSTATGPSSAPKQSSYAPAGVESSQKQFQNQSENDTVKPPFGRGRGMFKSSRGRGGFPSPIHNTINHNTGSGGSGRRDQRSHFSRTQKKPVPAKVKDPGPNPITLEDLKVAAMKGNTETVEKLLNQGIVTDIVLPSGWTTLMHAARVGSDDVVELLLKRGANASFQKEMFTVLMAVCDCDSGIDDEKVLHCVELLIEHGAKTTVYDRHRMSPLIYAARQGRVSVCEKLLERGAQINKTDGQGWTALSWAASKGHGRLIRVLLDHKADPKLYTSDGQSSSDIAYTSGYSTIAGILDAAASGTLGKRDLIISSSGDDKPKDDSPSLERYGELEVLLCGIQLGHLVPKFQEHKITFEGFAKMTDKDLDQIGVTQVGVRQKILEAIRDIHLKEWDMSSLQRQKNLLSAPEVTTVIANISKHLSVIESSVVFAQKQLECVTSPTQFVQDVAEADGLVFFAKEALKNSESICDKISSLQRQSIELSSQTQLLSADLISPKENPTNSTSRRGLLVLGIAAVAVGIFYIKKNGIQLTSFS